MTFCLPIPSMIPTGSSTVELLNVSKARSVFTVPSVLEEIMLLPDEQGIHTLQSLQFVAFGGGLLKASVGAILETAGVKLLNHYGATEAGPLAPIFVPKSDYDWRYFRLRDDIRNPLQLRLDPRPLTEDSHQQYSLSLRPPGWTERFEVQDLLVSNPRNPGTDYSAIGRNDDMIVLATGEKIVPTILESMLSQSELVKAALAFGDGRFEIGVLLEPMEQLAPDNVERFKLLVWPIIQEANRQMDAQSWISSQYAVIVVEPNSIPRADKGTVMRREAYKVFEEDINKAYMDLDTLVDAVAPLDFKTLEYDLKQLIQDHFHWKIPIEEWKDNHDFFELGMDSLQAVRLQRLLLASLPENLTHEESRSRISRAFVYQNPSITKLAYALRNLNKSSELENGHEDIQKLVDCYTLKSPVVSERRTGHYVLLTGSTGNLGSYVLASLVEQLNVTKVVCLNRPSKKDPFMRQQEAFKQRGITVSQDHWTKIQIYQSDLAASNLGLPNDLYIDLKKQLTHIIHNAWPMDFKLLLPSFESHFIILQNVLNLARDIHAANPAVMARVMFVSSIAVAGHYHDIHNEHIVPEVAFQNDNCTMDIGYAKAKLVCERVIERASRDYSGEIEVACARFGQIAGARSNGYWSSTEHVAALVKSSEKIGKLPVLQGV